MNRSVVFDSHAGRVCRNCRLPADRCKCGAVRAPTGDGIARVRREVRNGKTVTAILGVPLLPHELKKLAKDLKKKCGTGGSCKDGTIEIQGDHRELIVGELEGRGFSVKLAGG